MLGDPMNDSWREKDHMDTRAYPVPCLGRLCTASGHCHLMTRPDSVHLEPWIKINFLNLPALSISLQLHKSQTDRIANWIVSPLFSQC